MIRVLIESPLAAATVDDRLRNIQYARECVLDCLRRGEAPYASHLFFPQVLDDTNPVERQLGIEAGLLWGEAADRTVVYQDLGVSPGMQLGIARAHDVGRGVEYRKLGGRWS